MSSVTKSNICVVVHKRELKVFGPFETRNRAVLWITEYVTRPKIQDLGIKRHDCSICEMVAPLFDINTKAS